MDARGAFCSKCRRGLTSEPLPEPPLAELKFLFLTRTPGNVVRTAMATPNYSFEKRKRELAKKAAKEAKRLRKEEAKAAASESPASATPGSSAEGAEAPVKPENLA